MNKLVTAPLTTYADIPTLNHQISGGASDHFSSKTAWRMGSATAAWSSVRGTPTRANTRAARRNAKTCLRGCPDILLNVGKRTLERLAVSNELVWSERLNAKKYTPTSC